MLLLKLMSLLRQAGERREIHIRDAQCHRQTACVRLVDPDTPYELCIKNVEGDRYDIYQLCEEGVISRIEVSAEYANSVIENATEYDVVINNRRQWNRLYNQSRMQP